MHVWKSVLVFLLIMVFTIASICLLIVLILRRNNPQHLKGNICVAVLICSITLAAYLGGAWKYTYPFDRIVDLELVSVVSVSDDAQFSNPGVWCCVYEDLKLLNHIDTGFPVSRLEEWVDTDLSQYSYVISFGQQVELLSYNEWDTIQTPYYTNVKSGHIVLSDEFEPDKIYIYRFAKLRIDNPCF